jgi:hypothetical protein
MFTKPHSIINSNCTVVPVLKQNATRDVALAAAAAPVPLLQPAAVAQAQAQWIPAPPTITLETLASQQALLQEQIQQSEQNLAAQHVVSTSSWHFKCCGLLSGVFLVVSDNSHKSN